MEWKYVKHLKSRKNIEDFEQLVGYSFPPEFRKQVIEHNGGRPANRIFNTNKRKIYALKSFLSFNHEDLETVWKIREWSKEILTDEYVAFAIDNFGNLICFDKSDDSVVFANHEDSSVEKIADTFSAFLEALRPET